MDRRRFLGFVVFPAGIAAMLAFLFLVAKIDIFRQRTVEQSLAELKGSDDSGVRAKAAADLMARKDPAALPGLRDALSDPSPAVRCNAALAIAALAGPAATPDLARVLGDGDPDVRRVGAFLLGAGRDPGAREPLRKALGDKVETVRWNVAVALARLGDPAGLPTLHEMLRAPAPRSLGMVVNVLAPGAPMPLPEPDRTVHANALLALAIVGRPESVRPIEMFVEADIEPDLNEVAKRVIQQIEKRKTQ